MRGNGPEKSAPMHEIRGLADDVSLRAIADAVPQIIWSALPDGWIDWYNERWYAYTGQTADEAAGWGWQAVHHPDDLPEVMRAWPASIASGEPFEMEFRLRRADGAFRMFLTRATPQRDAGGQIVRWYGSNTDIEDEYRARLRDQFFSRLGAELAGALSLEQTLRVVTRLVVPQLADWALVNLIDEHGTSRLAAAYHPDDELRAMLEALRGEPYAAPTSQVGTVEVLRTGKPILYELVDEEDARGATTPPFYAAFRRIGFQSTLIVPLFSAGRVVGTLHAVMSKGGRTLSAADVPVFEELGRRITPAIGNATAYERERRVATTFQRAALVVVDARGSRTSVRRDLSGGDARSDGRRRLVRRVPASRRPRDDLDRRRRRQRARRGGRDGERAAEHSYRRADQPAARRRAQCRRPHRARDGRRAVRHRVRRRYRPHLVRAHLLERGASAGVFAERRRRGAVARRRRAAARAAPPLGRRRHDDRRPARLGAALLHRRLDRVRPRSARGGARRVRCAARRIGQRRAVGLRAHRARPPRARRRCDPGRDVREADDRDRRRAPRVALGVRLGRRGGRAPRRATTTRCACVPPACAATKCRARSSRSAN